jgi:hypothetical protein
MNSIISPLPVEEKLLLSLCRLNLASEKKAEITELMKEVRDWDRFVRLASDHGVIALSAYNIRQALLSGHVPPAVMKLLDDGRMLTITRNTWLTKRWKEVNMILAGAGIRHILLKGMALEHTIYGAKGLRQMTDTDILVKKDDVMKAWLLLQEHGFRSDMIKSVLHRKIITETGKHMPTLRMDGYPLDIHHRLFYEPDQNKLLNEAIDNAIAIEVEGTKAFILDDEIHLEYLKHHYLDHLASGEWQLRLYIDVELLRPGRVPTPVEEFLPGPQRQTGRIRQKEYYRIHYFALPRKVRFRYLAGDIFPSLRWMRQRHRCGTVKAMLLYPRRVGKLLWVVGR